MSNQTETSEAVSSEKSGGQFLFGDWQPIETAPKDGTLVDLLFPYPRGRTINCTWENHFGWTWRTPTWGASGLLPESQWDRHSYPNAMPTHWMKPPHAPD